MAVNAFCQVFWPSPGEGVYSTTLPLGRLSGPSLEGYALICTGMASMSAEGIQCYSRTTEAPVAYEAKLVMYHPQVIDDGPLILSIFSVPRAVGITGKLPKGIGVINPLQTHDLGGFLGGQTTSGI